MNEQILCTPCLLFGAYVLVPLCSTCFKSSGSMLALGIGAQALPGYILPWARNKMSFPGGFWGDPQWELAAETLEGYFLSVTSSP